MLRNLFVYFFLIISLSACKTLSSETVAISPQTAEPTASTHLPIDKPQTSSKAQPSLDAASSAEISIKKDDALLDIERSLIKPESIKINATAQADDVWVRLRQGMQLPELDNKRITVQRNWFLKHPEYLTRVIARAKPLLPYILDEIEKK